MSVVRPMSRLGTLAFKVPIKVPALGTVHAHLYCIALNTAPVLPRVSLKIFAEIRTPHFFYLR